MSHPAFDWFTTTGIALGKAFKRACSREQRLAFLDALEEVTRLASEAVS
jgi:hypothetical protein